MQYGKEIQHIDINIYDLPFYQRIFEIDLFELAERKEDDLKYIEKDSKGNLLIKEVSPPESGKYRLWYRAGGGFFLQYAEDAPASPWETFFEFDNDY